MGNRIPFKGPDTRLFRLTRVKRQHYTGKVIETVFEYGPRRVASAKAGAGGGSWKHGPVEKVEATNAEATEGWTDVTEEFRHLIGDPR